MDQGAGKIVSTGWADCRRCRGDLPCQFCILRGYRADWLRFSCKMQKVRGRCVLAMYKIVQAQGRSALDKVQSAAVPVPISSARSKKWRKSRADLLRPIGKMEEVQCRSAKHLDRWVMSRSKSISGLGQFQNHERERVVATRSRSWF